MSEHNKKKDSSSSNPIEKPHNALSGEILYSILVDLNIVRKSTLLYPPGHHQVKKSALNAFDRLQPIFTAIPEITIGVASDTLILDGKPLEPHHTIYRELARSLFSHGIVVLTLSRGLVAQELAFFWAILAKNVDQLQAEGGIDNAVKQYAIEHIKITLVDYDKFQITEESEIARNQTSDPAAFDSKIWQEFATQLMDNPSEQAHAYINPQIIAQLINKQPEKVNAVLKQYQKMLKNHLAKKTVDQLSSKSDRETISSINKLLHELNPQLKSQFLDTTLNECNQSVSLSQTFIAQLSQNLVAEMLQKANQEEGRISESLMNLMQKIIPTIDDTKESLSVKEAMDLDTSEKDQYQELFKQEDYENFVDRGYDLTLRRLGQGLNQENRLQDLKANFLNQENVLEQPYLDQHIIRAIKGLMDRCDSSEEYQDYSIKVVEIARKAIQKSQFQIVFEAIEIFNQHLKEKKSDEIRKIAQAAHAKLTDSKLIENLVQTLDQFDSQVPPHIGPLFKAIGPKIVPSLVERFMQGGQGEKQQTILKVLKQYQKESVAAAHQLVQRSDIEQIKKMIFLIRKIEDRASCAYLRSLVAHTNPDVSEKALAALLYFNDPWGIFFLRDHLNSKNPAEIAKMITMVGDYRIKEMVPDLATLLKYAALSKTDIKRNSELVTAMGKIGDAAAIPYLQKLLQHSWSLYRSNLRQLKVHIFTSLKGYPSAEIKPLLDIGPKLKDKTVDHICRQLTSPK
jgi:hypothetical protein